ncbi:MAG: sugar ABC transporter permease [Roseburia sp.]|nr:sugar ABC transporter permease [Roseburia sp.]
MKTVTIDHPGKKGLGQRFLKSVRKYGLFYLFAAPGLIYFLVFNYFPMFLGVLISLKNYTPFGGKGLAAIFDAEWAGIYHYKRLLQLPDFYRVLKNTIGISLMKLVVCFPLPIIFALLLNEVRHVKFKKTVQTISYLPHFISVVVIAGLLKTLLDPEGGVLTNVMNSLGFYSETSFLSDTRFYRPLLVLMNAWMKFGWDSIVYLSAITGVDVQLYEAAAIDGAGRFKKCIHVTLPAILPTIIVMLVLNVGHILDAGFQDILLTYSELTYSVADVIDTYVYRLGINGTSYGLSAAMGLFKSVVGLLLVVGTNKLANKFGENGLW